jgi:hypothetical protein
MLQCVECGLHGVLKDPTKDEWPEAFYSPSRPYLWSEMSRVVLTGNSAGNQRYVMRRPGDGPRCECYARRGVLEPGQFERVPVEVTRPTIKLNTEDRSEIRAVADLVAQSDLCSFLLPLFLSTIEEHTGHKPGKALLEVARRIEVIDRKGLHCSPSVLARVLRDIGGVGETH